MDKKDLYIKQKLQEDRTISNSAEQIFKNFKGGEEMIDKEKKVIKISFNKFIAIAVSVVIVGFLGISLYAQKLGRPNMISGIQALINNEEDAKSVKLDNFIESEIGISFSYPQEWKYVDNNHGSGFVTVGLEEYSNLEHNENICFSTTYDLNNEELTPKQYIEGMEEYKKSKKEGTIDIDENEGYYFETDEIKYDINKEYQNKEMTICIEANSMIYIMRFSGDEGLYDKYYKAFEEMLKTVKFNNPTYIEETYNTQKPTLENKYISLSIDTANKKMVDSNVEKYYIKESDDSFIELSIRNGKVYLTNKMSKDKWAEYGIVESKNDVKVNENFEAEITGFNKKVVDAKISCYGQSINEVFIVFLMEDGTVEYSTIQNAIKNLTTEGKVNNVSNVQRIYNCSIGWKDGGGISSVIALDSENNMYDIGYILDKQGRIVQSNGIS